VRPAWSVTLTREPVSRAGTGAAFAPDPAAKVGVWAGAESGRTALQVSGVAKFTRAGRVAFSAGQTTKKVTVAGGITSASFAVGNLQSNKSGFYVRAIVPSATDSSITIYLNKAATSSMTVGWLVIG
jgi:hypothetical protein